MTAYLYEQCIFDIFLGAFLANQSFAYVTMTFALFFSFYSLTVIVYSSTSIGEHEITSDMIDLAIILITTSLLYIKSCKINVFPYLSVRRNFFFRLRHFNCLQQLSSRFVNTGKYNSVV